MSKASKTTSLDTVKHTIKYANIKPNLGHVASMPMGKKISKNLFEDKEREEINQTSQKFLHACKYRYTSQSAASVRSSWTLLKVANVATHELQTATEQGHHKVHVGKKIDMTHSIPCSGKREKILLLCQNSAAVARE